MHWLLHKHEHKQISSLCKKLSIPKFAGFPRFVAKISIMCSSSFISYYQNCFQKGGRGYNKLKKAIMLLMDIIILCKVVGEAMVIWSGLL